MLIEPLDHPLVHFDEGAEAQFSPRVGDRTRIEGAWSPSQGVEDPKEALQLQGQGAAQQAAQEEKEPGERQVALAGEVPRPAFMALDKSLVFEGVFDEAN